MKSLSILLATILLFSPGFSGQALMTTTRHAPLTYLNPQTDPLNSVLLGRGFDSFKGIPMAQAVKSDAATTNSSAGLSESNVVEVESRQQVLDIMSYSMDAEFSGLLYSVKAGISSLDQTKFNSYDFYALAYEKVRLPSMILSSGSLINPTDAKTLSAEQFYQKYGDTWVNRVDMGGNLFGLIHVHTSSTEQKSQIEAHLSASGGGASFDAKMSAIHEAAQSIGTIDVYMEKSGAVPSFVTESNFLDECKKFPDQVVASKGTVVGFGLANYQTTNWPSPSNAQFDFSPARKAFRTANQIITQASGFIDNLNFVLANPKQFDLSKVTADTVTAEKANLGKLVQTTKDIADNIASYPLKAKSVTYYDFAGIKFPERIVPPPPQFPMSYGQYGCCVLPGSGNDWISATPTFDSIGMGPATGPQDVQFIYEGKFRLFRLVAGGITVQQSPSMSNGSRTFVPGNIGIIGLRVSLGGNDAGLYDVCYQFMLQGQTQPSSPAQCNGQWLDAPPNNFVTKILVKLKEKSN